MMSSLFTRRNNLTFAQVWEDSSAFLNDYHGCGLTTTISDNYATTLYYLLYGKYGNSTILNFDLNQFKYAVFSTVFMYGPAWEERLELQAKIKALSDEEIVQGDTQISNHASHPSADNEQTNAFEVLNFIDTQNAAQTRRNKLNALALKYNQIVTDVTEEFLVKFKKLFRTIIAAPVLLYEGDDDDN